MLQRLAISITIFRFLPDIDSLRKPSTVLRTAHQNATMPSVWTYMARGTAMLKGEAMKATYVVASECGPHVIEKR